MEKGRLKEHNDGLVISTKVRGPLILVLYEAYKIEKDARTRELFFKTTKGKIQLRKQLHSFLFTKQADVA